MDLATFVDLISALTLVCGFGFAVVQLRLHRAARDREIGLELLRSFQTPDFARALRAVYRLPDGLSKREIEEHLGDNMDAVYALMTTWESIGALVHRGEIRLDLVEDFFSGPVRISWQKLAGYVRGERDEQRRETIEEWFEWLNDRIADRESALPPVPAHIAYRNWRPRAH
jgi:hypothetical protein